MKMPPGLCRSCGRSTGSKRRRWCDEHRPQSKYRSRKVRQDGVVFDSAREARRWTELCLMQKEGLISDLERQVTYDLIVRGILVTRYRCDFRYRENGALTVEDAKGYKTEAYKIKARLMMATYGIVIKEV